MDHAPELTGELVVLAACLFTSIIMVILGIPLLLKRVPPNPLYGFRVPQTLRDAEVWYRTNQVAARWCIATGIVTAIVTIGTYAVGMKLPQGALLNLVPLLVGITAMVVHGLAVCRR